MDKATLSLLAAGALFAGTHYALSHPLRAPLVRAMGERLFMLFYSLVALALFAWMIVAFDGAPAAPLLWNGAAALPWLVSSVLTVVALALFLASLVGNPALPQANVAGLSARKPWGVYRITRHPMMFGFALWAVAHILVAPSPRTLILAGTILVVALVGAHLQDRKKIALHDREWRAWVKRTSFWPSPAKLGLLGWVWLPAAILWLLATWAHWHFAGIPAGPWMWLDLPHPAAAAVA